MTRAGRWGVRCGVLASLIVTPFWKFALRNEYGLATVEVAAATAVLAAMCALLAVIASKDCAFYALLATVIGVTGAAPLAGLVTLKLWLSLAVLVAASGVLGWLMRERFLVVVAVFTLSGLAVEAAGQIRTASLLRSAARHRQEQVLWLVLDEQMGLNGLPATTECGAARQRLETTLTRHAFAMFPNAYSNYAGTIDSIPSLLNGRLLSRPLELIEQIGEDGLRHYRVRANELFQQFAARGYRVECYQHGSLKWCDPGKGATECHEYGDRLGRMRRANGPWTTRFRWLVANYQASDPYLKHVRGFFPFRAGNSGLTGSLAVAELWPDRLAENILAEPRQTLFFVHLLTPHSPYLYRPDGSVRPLEEWVGDRADMKLGRAAYNARYRRYCGQVEYVAGELDRFLERLRHEGALEQMTVIIHGDHGSRIRILPEGQERAVDEDAEQWSAGLTRRDLQDRFSTLLAIRKRGARRPEVRPERHSVLTLLSREVFEREPDGGAERADNVYLFDRKFQYQAVEIRKQWSD